jgi:hypothetical protein
VTAEDQRRWTLSCRDEAARERVHHVEVTDHGVIRLVPPMVGPTLWEPEQIDRLVHVLLDARAAAIRRRGG